jgi:hypothetical protein
MSKDGKYTYAILLNTPKDKIILKSVYAKPDSKISMLGSNEQLKWDQADGKLTIQIPEKLPSKYANILKIELLLYTENPVIKIDKKIYIDEPAKIIINSNTEGASIYYTLDESEPTEKSIRYNEPFVLENSKNIKAKAFKKGLIESLTSQMRVNIVDSKVNGLNYKYYEGKWEKIPDFVNLKHVRSGKTFEINLSEIKPKEDYFGVLFEGFIKIEKEGEYTFFIKSDDGSKLFLDNKELVNNDGIHGDTEKSSKISLKKGYHPVKIEFFEYTGDQSIQVSYKGPNIEKQIIPAVMFFIGNK